jgi:hypothetical protein
MPERTFARKNPKKQHTQTKKTDLAAKKQTKMSNPQIIYDDDILQAGFDTELLLDQIWYARYQDLKERIDNEARIYADNDEEVQIWKEKCQRAQETAKKIEWRWRGYPGSLGPWTDSQWRTLNATFSVLCCLVNQCRGFEAPDEIDIVEDQYGNPLGTTSAQERKPIAISLSSDDLAEADRVALARWSNIEKKGIYMTVV